MARGTIEKYEGPRGTSWRVRADYIDPVTGKRVRPMRTYDTRREAETGLTQWLHELNTGSAVKDNKLTVAELLNDWIDHVETRGTHERSTIAGYRSTIRTHLIPGIGAIRAQALTTAMLNTWYTKMLKAGTGPRTVQLCHLRVHQALNHAMDLGIVARNAAARAKPPAAPAKQVPIWDADQVRTFAQEAAGDALAPLWLILATTGMRRGEIVALRWCDVDVDACTLTVAQAIGLDEGRPYPKVPKGGRQRTIGVPAEVIEALRAYRQRRPVAIAKDALIFTTRTGRGIHPDEIIDLQDAIVARAGLPRITTHALRHTCATLLLRAGEDLLAVSKQLGHSKPSITQDLYGNHANPRMARAVAATMRGILFDPPADREGAR